MLFFSAFFAFPLRRQLPVGNQSVRGGKKRKNEEGSILQQAEGKSKRRRRKRQKDTFSSTPPDLKGPSPRWKVQNHQLFFKYVPDLNDALVFENTEKQIVEK